VGPNLPAATACPSARHLLSEVFVIAGACHLRPTQPSVLPRGMEGAHAEAAQADRSRKPEALHPPAFKINAPAGHQSTLESG
jgi:hypothetical protein